MTIFVSGLFFTRVTLRMNDYFDSIKYTKGNPPLELEDSEFVECTFNGCDLSEAVFRNTKVLESYFENCNLSNISVTNTTLRDVKFKGCKIIGVNWSSIQAMSDVSFEDCILNFSVFQGLNLSGLAFKNCSIHEVDFSGSKLIKANFSSSSLTLSSFTDCSLEGADFREATNYFIDPKFTNVKKARFSMPEAMVLLKSFDIILD